MAQMPQAASMNRPGIASQRKNNRPEQQKNHMPIQNEWQKRGGVSEFMEAQWAPENQLPGCCKNESARRQLRDNPKTAATRDTS